MADQHGRTSETTIDGNCGTQGTAECQPSTVEFLILAIYLSAAKPEMEDLAQDLELDQVVSLGGGAAGFHQCRAFGAVGGLGTVEG